MAADPEATTALPDGVKKNLKSIVLELRHLFEADLGLGLKRLGIDTEVGTVTAAGDPALSYLSAEELEVRAALDVVLAKEVAMTKNVAEGLRALLREAAYTHLNRLIGLKCLELRGHLEIDGERTEVVTQRSDYGDLSKYLWTLRSRDARLLGDPETLWREGLLRACTAASAELGVLFDPADPYAHVWPSHKALVQAVRTLDELPESAFRTDELLGWVYQYFQSEEKDRVFAEVKTKKKKIAWADIVPATQLYTERYMVDFLLQNSIGARWMEMHPDSHAKEAWLYYVEPATPHAREPRAVKEWTLLDPCCGSGHFLVVAFDLLVQLYAEERALADQGLIPADWAVPEAEVARTILARNLHGIDIDPRAVQLSALALYLKAKELGLKGTPQMHLVIADSVLRRGANYRALLDIYHDDAAATESIEVIWSSLEHVRDLGSLVRIEEEAEAAVEKARERAVGSFDDLADWSLYKRDLIARLRGTFEVEASSRDERQRVFGAEAEKGLGLFELLSARYDVVCLNPPYVGSTKMGSVLKEYTSSRYPEARTDLYAAFVARALALTTSSSGGGQVAVVTPVGWLSLSQFKDLRRSVAESAAVGPVVDLGQGAFTDSPLLFVALCVFRRDVDGQLRVDHAVQGARLRGERASSATLAYSGGVSWSAVRQSVLANLPDGPLMSFLPQTLVELLASERSLAASCDVAHGLSTSDNHRFVRRFWELPAVLPPEWVPYVKGEGSRRWAGLRQEVVHWGDQGSDIQAATLQKYDYLTPNSPWVLQGKGWYFVRGATYSTVAGGRLAARAMDAAVFDAGSAGVFPRDPGFYPLLLGILNTRLYNALMRSLCPGLIFRETYVGRLPQPSLMAPERDQVSDTARWLVAAKERLNRSNPSAKDFVACPLPRRQNAGASCGDAVLSVGEALVEEKVAAGLGVSSSDQQFVFFDVGTPAGLNPPIAGYDMLPDLPRGWPSLPRCLKDDFNEHARIAVGPNDMLGLKARLRALYVAGPGADAEDEAETTSGDDEDDAPRVGNAPLPPETFVEELSEKLEIHPVSVFWLLEELRRQEGLVCPPEHRRETEDWLSVTLLRMLGHRWPAQDEGEVQDGPFMDRAWVDRDGIIALTSGMGEETLAGRFRRFLDAEFGAEDGHEIELELAHTLGWKVGIEWGNQKSLDPERWFERAFFRRHVSQFKRRPIAWHFKSPGGTVQVVVYYHAFNRDRLALLRARYLGDLRQELNSKLGALQAEGYRDRSTLARVEDIEVRLDDLRVFDAKLAHLQEGRQREARIWCPWKTPEEQPQGWNPDINDGVRVNIAPLQRLGLLASDVLAKKDLKSLLAPEGRG